MSDDRTTAQRAREIALRIDPQFVACIDAIRGAFGARLLYLRVESGDETISVGSEEAGKTWEATPPLARYLSPKEAREEWEEEKRALYSRDAARDRNSGRGIKRGDGGGTQIPFNTQMEI